MSQRVSGYDREDGDFYPTPPWVTEALLPHIPARVKAIWEPAAGDGAMSRVLLDARYRVMATDIEARGAEAGVIAGPRWDFPRIHALPFAADAIVTNPPYETALNFIMRALALTHAEGGFVAMLLRIDYHCAASRQALFGRHPAFAKQLVLTRRIQWFPEGGGSPSYNHAWYIWDWRHEGPAELVYGPEAEQRELLEAV